MKIYKVIADEKPEWCMLCPLARHAIGADKDGLCGKYVERDMGDGWKTGGTEPDERCVFGIVSEGGGRA